MGDVEIVDRVASALAVDHEEFQARVAEETDVLLEELKAGTFDNPQANLGLEVEFYAVDVSESGSRTAQTGADEQTFGQLRRVPRRLLSMIGMDKELGLHNAEMRTSPQPFNEYGLEAQLSEVAARLSAAQECTRTEGIALVSDGMWTIPPAGETATEYLTASVESDGITVATNMSNAARYHSMANTEHANVGMELVAPHVSLPAETVMPESLITSIQPHFQVPHASDLPKYFNYALRIAAPLLALGANSPLFPPDLYDDGTTIEDALTDGWDEHRIVVFESVLNDPTASRGKVRFPRDLSSVEEAIERIATDDPLVPMMAEDTGRFDDAFGHFRHKHGTYWRWVRPVFDGPSRSGANARIEFRPLPAQPTIRDAIAFQAAVAGLLTSLPRVEHPVADLEWKYVHANFYAAARDGMDANLVWITNDGEETRTPGKLYGDLLAHAADGLESAGLSEAAVERFLAPLRTRANAFTNPADWKRDRAQEAAEDGASFEEAITMAQQEYLRAQQGSLIEGTFAEWKGVQ